MKNNKWFINHTENFDEIEQIEVNIEKIDAKHIEVKTNNQTYRCKYIPTWRFFLKRYPIMIIPTFLLSIIFLAIHPLAFFIYVCFTIFIFSFTNRICKIHEIGTYIMWFWIIHLLGNFFILSSDSISLMGFAMAISNKHYYIQSLFFGMLLTHLWIYTLIFFYQYHRVYTIIKKEDDTYQSTPWYLWQKCPLCNKHYNPFKKNCGNLL